MRKEIKDKCEELKLKLEAVSSIEHMNAELLKSIAESLIIISEKVNKRWL